MKKTVVAFDFDGTLTRSDTFLPFLKFSLGTLRFSLALLRNSFWLFLYAIKIYPNWKAKKRLFATCFAGWKKEEFEQAGQLFAYCHRSVLRHKAACVLKKHIEDGAHVYIISASMEAWVKPLLKEFPSLIYLTTCPEVTNGYLTGRFSSTNCYGIEKANRLLAIEPLRETYTLYAYGNSKGDKELLRLADYGYYRSFEKHKKKQI